MPWKRSPPDLVFEVLLEAAHIVEALAPHRSRRIEVLDLLLRDVGDAEAPVVVRDVARDDHAPELKNVPAGGLDVGRPEIHVGVTVRLTALEHLKSVGVPPNTRASKATSARGAVSHRAGGQGGRR